MSDAVKIITLPTGTVISEDEHPEMLWAVIASPAQADLARESDEDHFRITLGKIDELNAAIAAPEVRIEEALTAPTAVLVQAYLGDSGASVLLDEDHDVVDVDIRASSDGSLFPKTGQSIVDALTADARRQILDLRRVAAEHTSDAESESQEDPRLSWRVLRWMRTEESAVKFLAKLGNYAEIGSDVSVLRAVLQP
jgi:hypothetical protein